MPLVREAGAAVVALTIDEAGMAKTRERKLEIARRIYDIVHDRVRPAARRADLRRAHLHARDRRRGIPRFGRRDDRGHPADQARAARRPDLARRLERLVRPQAGGARRAQFGDAASLRRGRARHGDRQPQRDHALRGTRCGRTRAVRRSRLQPSARRAPARDRTLGSEGRARRAAASAVDDDADAPIETRIHNAILRRRKDGIEAKLDEVLARRDPVDVLNNVLLPAMKEVGDKFGAGELILPFVLQSAEVMKKAVAHLEQFLEKPRASPKGRSCSRPCSATCTTSARTSSTRSSRTTATPSTISANRCR